MLQNSSFDTILNGSNTSGTSSLSISSTSQSAFEPLQQCSTDGSAMYSEQSAFCAVSANPSAKPEPVSASIVVASHKSSRPGADMRPSLSDFALGQNNFSTYSQNLSENAIIRMSQTHCGAPVYEKNHTAYEKNHAVYEKNHAVYEKNHARLPPPSSSSFPSDLPFPPAVSVSPTTMSLEKSSPLKKCEDNHGQAMNSVGIRQLPVCHL